MGASRIHDLKVELAASQGETTKWKSRYEYVDSTLANTVNSVFDTAENNYKTDVEQSVGVNCGSQNIVEGNSWFKSVTQITMGAVFGAVVYAYASSSNKLVDESELLL